MLIVVTPLWFVAAKNELIRPADLDGCRSNEALEDIRVNTRKSLIALGIFGILLGSAWQISVAKQSDEDEDSVRRWGRWAVLSPAAGQEETGGFVVPEGDNLGSCESSENCPTLLVGTTSSGGGSTSSGGGSSTSSSGGDSSSSSSSGGGSTSTSSSGGAMAPCAPGTACGFARIDQPYDGQGTAAESSELAPFELTIDQDEGSFGTVSYVVDPGTEGEIASGPISAIITPTDLLGLSLDPIIAGTITPNNDGNPAVVTGPWVVGDAGGEYVWGVTATAVQMQSLVDSLGSDKIATYSGKTLGVVNGGEGEVNLSFNFSNNSWSGQFDNNAFSVTDGVIVESGFVTTAASNLSGSIASGTAYGAFVNAGDNAIGAYDVTTTGGSRLVDAFNTQRDITQQLE